MSTYYQYEDVKLAIAHKLMNIDGWKIYGYKQDESDMMTDYWSPASWGGVAEKNGYILCVNVYGASQERVVRSHTTEGGLPQKDREKIQKLEMMTTDRGASAEEERSAKEKIEILMKKAEESKKPNETIIEVIPGHMAHPTRCNWHIEKDGNIVAKGNGILKYANLGEFPKRKNESKEEIKNSLKNYYNDSELERAVDYRLEQNKKYNKLLDSFNKFINKLDTTCGSLVGEGELYEYEKITVTEYKTETKAVETTEGSVKEGQCFVLKTNFNYGCHKGLVYRIHERKLENGTSYFYAYKLNGKLTKECTGQANSNNRWGCFGEKFLQWVQEGHISFCKLEEVKVAYEVEKVVKKKKATTKKQNRKTNTENKTDNKTSIEAQDAIVNCTIQQSKHTKTGDDIWIVKLDQTVTKQEFSDILHKMAEIKGYYSRFVHGFVFKYDPCVKLESLDFVKSQKIA